MSQEPVNTEAFTIRVAREEDAAAVHRLVFERPDKNIRLRSLKEVQTIIKERTVHLVISDETGELVGACYVDLARADPREWEIGGAFIHPDYRRAGLSRLLAVTAILNHTATNRRLSGKPEAMIGHVVNTNQKPRRVLESLGFSVRDSNQRFEPGDISGLEHMDTEAGFIYADTYELAPQSYSRLITELLDFDGTVPGEDGTRRRVTIRIASLEPEMLDDLRKDLQADFG